MNSAIRINRLKYSIIHAEISKKYKVFQFKTTDKYFSSGSYIFDDPVLNKKVLSVLFESGKIFYVLTDFDSVTERDFREILNKTEEGAKISFETTDVISLPDNIILQLMLNALSSQNLPFLKYSNLTGHFYVFHPEWIERTKKDSTIFRIKSLEYKISSENNLLINVRTFTSAALKRQITFRKKKYKDYPKYVISSGNTLRRKLKSDTQTEEFILRQTDNKKSEIPFLDFTNLNSFESSKIGVTANVIESFNEKYKGYAAIDFDSVSIYSSIDCKSTLKKANDKVVTELLKKNGVKIIDCISDEYSHIFCQKVSDAFKSKYDVNADLGKRLSKKELNIRVIHNDTYYGTEIVDPHDHIPEGYSLQHITFEDFCNHIESAVTTVAHEVIIKDDINKGIISLYDWKSLEFNDTVSFGIKADGEDGEKYYFMDVRSDGTFVIKECVLDLFSSDIYNDMVKIFCDNNDVEGVVRFADGDINIIKNTGLITLPELFKIKDELKSQNFISRGKESRDELLSAVLDIKLYNEEGVDYYFVGTVGSGMRSKIERASLIRKIEGYNGSKSRFESLLPLMNIVFVRNGQLTVYPFPFKYLNEYVSLKNRHLSE